MNTKRPLICTGINDNYAWPWMVSIFSAKMYSEIPFDVALGAIRGRISPQTRSMLERFCERIDINLIFKEFEFYDKVQVDSRITAESYLRLLWLDYLDSDFMWLDSDTLPLANWDKIFDVVSKANSETSIIFAAIDHYTSPWSHLQQDNDAVRIAGKSYFNAGIVIVRPSLWKTKKYDSVWRKVGSKYIEHGFKFWDQDILNYILNEEKTLISSQYNFIVPTDPKNISARILHFAGSPKPWHLSKNARSYFLACESLEKKEREKSSFLAPGWEMPYENYYRHENALLHEFQDTPALYKELQTCADNSRSPIMSKKDEIKFMALTRAGRKWL